MNLVTGALSSLIPKLLELLKEEYNLHKGLKDEVMSLKLELESAHAALRIVGEVPPGHQHDELVMIWARGVRDASYDMEDLLDTFLVRVEGCEPTNPHWVKRLKEKIHGLFSKSKARHEIAGMIRDIKKRVDEVAERRRRYKVDDIVI